MSTQGNENEVTLPGTPGRVLRAAWGALNPQARAALLPHLIGDTSAEYLADWLHRMHLPVSASTIRTYRRSIRQTGV